MEALQHTFSHVGTIRRSRQSIFQQFLAWCTNQEKNRLLWLAIIITSHGCVITPITALMVMSTGNNIFFLALTIAGMTMPLVCNLSAMPTRITIPVFFLSIVFDLVVLIGCLMAVIG